MNIFGDADESADSSESYSSYTSNPFDGTCSECVNVSLIKFLKAKLFWVSFSPKKGLRLGLFSRRSSSSDSDSESGSGSDLDSDENSFQALRFYIDFNLIQLAICAAIIYIFFFIFGRPYSRVDNTNCVHFD